MLHHLTRRRQEIVIPAFVAAATGQVQPLAAELSCLKTLNFNALTKFSKKILCWSIPAGQYTILNRLTRDGDAWCNESVSNKIRSKQVAGSLSSTCMTSRCDKSASVAVEMSPSQCSHLQFDYSLIFDELLKTELRMPSTTTPPARKENS
jgi:hypothetical protein